ncbi:MAG: DinB family protein, partial [bacterium]|nr:DinB family protein [bacterium]
EVQFYSNGEDLWKTTGGISNSGGNLCLHICGNLEHFFGAVLAKSGYIRERDAELSNTDVPRDQLLAGVDAARHSVLSTLAGLTEQDLDSPYPLEVFGHSMTTGYFLTHLATHLNYHLGQINY